MKSGFALFCIFLLPPLAFAKNVETLGNSKVLVTQVVLASNETEQVADKYPSADVYWTAASFQVTRVRGNQRKISVREGGALFEPAGRRSIKNTGQGELRFVHIEFLDRGTSEMWRNTGLPPNYRLLFENRYARVYEIRIRAHSVEPRHTHHDRVVVCVSGAKLKHRYADGHEEVSTLATGETVWRRGGTHVGQNLGDTDLWAIAIEPK